MLDIIRSLLDILRMDIFLPSDEALTVSLVVLPGSSMMSVACTVDPLRAANRRAGKTVFDWTIHTFDGGPALLSCGLPLTVDSGFDPNARGDILIFIAGFDSNIHADKTSVTKIAKAASGYACVGGVEAGSWLLARAGLLNGRSATTHWEDLEDFAQSHPQIDVIPDRFVIDGKYFTSGGASPTVDFMLHLFRSRCGIAFAMEVASAFIYDEAHSPTDAQSIVSLGQLHHLEPRIAEAIKMMESHIDEPLSVAEIARDLDLSVRSLENLFQTTLQVSPGKYYRALRLNIARRLVTETKLSAQEIAIRTGFGSLSAFSRSFRNSFGISPIQARLSK